MFKWESWRCLRNYLGMDNLKKWKIYSLSNISWVSDTLGNFLRILMIVNELEFEDTVYMLKNNLQAKLVHEI